MVTSFGGFMYVHACDTLRDLSRAPFSLLAWSYCITKTPVKRSLDLYKCVWRQEDTSVLYLSQAPLFYEHILRQWLAWNLLNSLDWVLTAQPVEFWACTIMPSFSAWALGIKPMSRGLQTYVTYPLSHLWSPNPINFLTLIVSEWTPRSYLAFRVLTFRVHIMVWARLSCPNTASDLHLGSRFFSSLWRSPVNPV